jgi:tetratricopeptide (TPR) repeat protein/uncharacterized membrane protein YgcG
MKLTTFQDLKQLAMLLLSLALVFIVSTEPLGQTQLEHLPAPTTHVNDLAGVLDLSTSQRLENLLENVKQRTGIEFTLATVKTTRGRDIFDVSLQLAHDWDIGSPTSTSKSLLLVVAAEEKTFFTQFSRKVLPDLPEGTLGEMAQRMRQAISSGRINEGVLAGVQHFVAVLGEKVGFALNATDQPADAVQAPVAAFTEATAAKDGRARRVMAPDKRVTDSVAIESKLKETETETANASNPVTVTPKAPVVSKNKSLSANDEAEAEAVELTLTLRLSERIAKLKEFEMAHPSSASKARAGELLISAYAALGDQKLKEGNNTSGIELMMQAINDSPMDVSEKLFSGVLSQIPLNLYLRGERAAAFKAAQAAEAKAGNDSQRLLAVAGFYLAIEQGDEAVRLVRHAITLTPELAEAHNALGLALHLSLRLNEAAAEYKRALELDPKIKGARRSLADLNRAAGKYEEALALYRDQLLVEPSDKAVRAGVVLSLFGLEKNDEAERELEAALKDDPQNLALLTGAAYWLVAHNDSQRALGFAQKAVQVEPRYTWAEIALARARIAQKQPLEAERALRFAMQYGKFPTLDYELASALASLGLYEEAAEVLVHSFTLGDGGIETQLAGHVPAQAANFIELLAPERRGGIFQTTEADSESNARILKGLLAFTTATNPQRRGGIDEAASLAAAREFTTGSDDLLAYRQLYSASRLARSRIGLQAALDLANSAKNGVEAALNVPAVTVAVQADELREMRARAIAAGGTPDIPDAPRYVLSNILRGRIEDLTGWILFNQDKPDEGVLHLRRAASVLPENTPSWRTALWHLGAALEQSGSKEEALSYYIKSYNAGDPEIVRRTVIEQLYKKVNGSVDGLDSRIGPAPLGSVSSTDQSQAADIKRTIEPVAANRPSPETPPTAVLPGAEPTSTPSPEPSAPTEPTPPPSQPVSSPTAEPASQPTPQSTPTPTPETSTPPSAQPAPMRPSLPLLVRIQLGGRVQDSEKKGIANVVVVLIGPKGTVMAATTDAQGDYSFTVAGPSADYRIIPSKEGYTFDPIDKTLRMVAADQKDVDFVGAPARSP